MITALPAAATEDFEAPIAIDSLGWKFVSPPRLDSKSTEFGGEVDKAGYANIIPERSDSLLTTARLLGPLSSSQF
jgi:hypothetical protein